MVHKSTHKLRIVFLLVLSFALSSIAKSQITTLTLEQCHQLALNNYPLIKQINLLEKSKEFSLDNTAKGNYPQFSVIGQATYQSDVTSLPISMPGINITPLSKDQYRAYVEVYQPLTDFRNVRNQQEIIKATTEIEIQKIEVELYKLKDRINQLYFSVLLLNLQIQQSLLLRKDVNANLDKINTATQNGTSTRMNANILKAEIIKIDQRITEYEASKKATTNVLEIFIKSTITDSTQFTIPFSYTPQPIINRPELKLYDLQRKIFNIQLKQIDNRLIPRVGLFLQGGIGRPGLNALSNEFAGYYIGGLKFNWNLNSIYTAKKERSNLDINLKSIEVQRETFLLNTNLTATQQNTELTKYFDLINTDNELIALRESIAKTASVQLSNGIISPLDYIIFLNAEDQAKQNLVVHQIQLLMAQYSHKNTTGN